MKNSKDNVLRHALNELHWTDDAIRKFLSLESSSEPIDCKPGCHYCCFNLPMVTPPEALLIGHYTDQNFTHRQKHTLKKRNREIIKKIAGKRADELFMMRHELPCIFLKDKMCLIYEVRPAVCRACSSTLAGHCKMIFETKNHRARLRSYPQLREIFETVHLRLITFCRGKKRQSDALRLTDTIEDYYNHPDPTVAWLQGKTVFHCSI